MRPGPIAMVAMRKTTARPLGARGERRRSALGEPKRREGRENDERRHPEDVATKASQAVAANEAPAVVKIVRDDEVEIGPNRENAQRQRSQRDIDEPTLGSSSGAKPRDRSYRSQAPRCCAGLPRAARAAGDRS